MLNYGRLLLTNMLNHGNLFYKNKINYTFLILIKVNMSQLIKYNNIEYFMPFLFCNDIYIPVLNKLLKDEVNPIRYVYGSLFCAWGGGRICNFKLSNLHRVNNYLEQLKKYKVIPTFTFTNLCVKDKLNDEYSNNLLDIAYDNGAHFIVATEELYNHIKSRYHEAKMHCSVIVPSIKRIDEKSFDETRFYNKMLDKYEIVIIRPEYTMENINKLDKLIRDISRVEVLINQYCKYNCEMHKEHYNFLSQIENYKYNNVELPKEVQQKFANNSESNDIFSLCPKNNVNNKESRSVFLSQEQIEQVINIGVKKLKIQGRSYNFNDLFNQLYLYFFNNEIPCSEIRDKTDKICAQIIQENRKASLLCI